MKLEDLKLYQECLNFESQIWKIVEKWEGFNKETMGKSFVVASDSISSNIAAGYGRYNFKDKKHYCYISRGFLLETKGWIIKSKERELIGAEEAEELIEFVEKIHRMLNAYVRSIGRVKESNSSSNGYSNNRNTENKEEVDGNMVPNESDSESNGNSFTASADEFFSTEELTTNA